MPARLPPWLLWELCSNVTLKKMLMWDLKKNDINELIYKTETDLQTERMTLYLPGAGWEGEGGIDGESLRLTCTHCYTENK